MHANETDVECDYSHDGRVLFEVLNSNHLPSSIASQPVLFGNLVNALKAIDAPVGQLGLSVLKLSTTGVLSSNGAYGATEQQLKGIGNQRDAIAKQMKSMIENSEFHFTPLDSGAANALIAQAQSLLGSLPP